MISKDFASLKNNLWTAAIHSSSCDKAVTAIRVLSRETGIKQYGLMASLILSGLKHDPFVKPYREQIEAAWQESAEKTQNQK